MKKLAAGSIGALVALGIAAAAQAAAPALAGRHALGLHGGLWGQSESRVAVDAAEVSVTGGGAAGGIRYLRWFDEGWAFELASLAQSEGEVDVASAGEVRTTSANAVAILIGGRRYLPAASFTTGVRPFLAAGCGPCIGYADHVRVTDEVALESDTQFAFAAQLAGGVDFALGRRLLLELAGG
jgi:opacity protein-like surface antigen